MQKWTFRWTRRKCSLGWEVREFFNTCFMASEVDCVLLVAELVGLLITIAQLQEDTSAANSTTLDGILTQIPARSEVEFGSVVC